MNAAEMMDQSIARIEMTSSDQIPELVATVIKEGLTIVFNPDDSVMVLDQYSNEVAMLNDWAPIWWTTDEAKHTTLGAAIKHWRES